VARREEIIAPDIPSRYQADMQMQRFGEALAAADVEMDKCARMEREIEQFVFQLPRQSGSVTRIGLRANG